MCSGTRAADYTASMDLLLENTRCRVRVAAAHGGRIASLNVLGEELLVDANDDPLAWGSYPLAPWAGRLRDGHFHFDGHARRIVQAGVRHPMHGTVLTRAWERTATDTLRCGFGSDWPFGGFALQRFTLADDSLSVRLELHAEHTSYPASAGFHPWFRRRLTRGGLLRLHCDAAMRAVLDRDGLPTGALLPATRRDGDECLTALRQDPCLHWPGALRLEIGSSHPWWVVYEKPQHALCVEPWTAPPDALNSQPAIVHPGAPLVLEMRLRWRSDDADECA